MSGEAERNGAATPGAAGGAPGEGAAATMREFERSPALTALFENVWNKPGARNPYIFRDGRGVLFEWSERDFSRRLRSEGLSSRVALGETMSPVDRFIDRIQRERSVHQVLPALAGYREGERLMNGNRVLVLKSPALPEPVPGSCEMLLAFVRQFLGEAWAGRPDQDLEFTNQFATVCYWMARRYQAIRDEDPTCFSQVLFLIGEPGAGKTLFQEKVLTWILGGRAYKMNENVTGEERFNGPTFEYEHLYVSDAQGGGSKYEERMRQQKRLKEMATGEYHTCRAIYEAGATLSPVWTVSYSGNVDKLNELPPWDADFADKAHLIKGCRAWRPDGSAFKKWEKQLRDEIPAFVHFLLENYGDSSSLPGPLQESSGGGRFGQLAFHHPELLRNLNAFSIEARLRDVINALLFADGLEEKRSFTIEELRQGLRAKATTRGQERDVESVLAGGAIWLGRRLGKLAELYPLEYENVHTAKGSRWIIRKASSRIDTNEG